MERSGPLLGGRFAMIEQMLQAVHCQCQHAHICRVAVAIKVLVEFDRENVVQFLFGSVQFAVSLLSKPYG